jgi:hypothetical protein
MVAAGEIAFAQVCHAVLAVKGCALKRLRPLAGKPLDRCAASCLWWAGNPACSLESSMKKLKLDRAALKTALRTAGALMLGNAFVGVLLLGNRDWLAVLALLVAGGAVIILTSIEHKE